MVSASFVHLLAVLFSFCAIITSFYLLYFDVNKPLYVLSFITLVLFTISIGHYIYTKKNVQSCK